MRRILASEEVKKMTDPCRRAILVLAECAAVKVSLTKFDKIFGIMLDAMELFVF